MPAFSVGVHITPRKGLLDPQGQAVAGALQSVGFAEVAAVHVGRYVVVETSSANTSAARATVEDMCVRLLANPVTEDFHVEEPVSL